MTGVPLALAELDPAKLAGLRRMKVIAGGALIFAAIVFVISVVIGDDHGAWPYLKAASEAAMVGGLADWFAVTALFRHPLGLPIPHTAIIPRKKDQIGASLGEFIEQNFLTGEIVAPRILEAKVASRTGEWLASPGRAEKLAGEWAVLVTASNTVFLEDDAIRASLEQFIDAQLRRIPVAPVVAKVLDVAVEGDQHQLALTEGLRAMMRFLSDNREVFRRRLAEESPEWVPEWIDDRVFAKLFGGVQSFLADVAVDPNHALRKVFDQRLRDYAMQLRTDPMAAARLEQVKIDLLDHPVVRNAIGSLWLPLKDAVLQAAADPDSELRRVVASVVRQVGIALRDDVDLQAKVDRWIVVTVDHILKNYSSDLVSVITHTVARWDTESTSRRLELQVGRDLQFIRINGTVVGSIVGLLIYIISRFL